MGKISLAAAVLVSAVLAERDAVLDESRELQAITKPFPYPWWKWRQSYCKMQWNPMYPTTHPWGLFWLREYGAPSPLYIWGNMYQLPTINSKHGFTINTKAFDQKDCRSTEPHWNPFWQAHGYMNTMPSHAGDLDPVISNASSSASYSVAAWQPTLYGSYTVNGRSMCLYEKFGPYESMFGRQIACCDIRPYWVLYPYPYYPYDRQL